jgi:hypothetical protein
MTHKIYCVTSDEKIINCTLPFNQQVRLLSCSRSCAIIVTNDDNCIHIYSNEYRTFVLFEYYDLDKITKLSCCDTSAVLVTETNKMVIIINLDGGCDKWEVYEDTFEENIRYLACGKDICTFVTGMYCIQCYSGGIEL